MLRVHSYTQTSLRYYGLNFNGIRFAVTGLSDDSYEFRPSTEKLIQGGVFDEFGNKAVRHDQWKGDVYPLPANDYFVDRFPTDGGWITRPLAQVKSGSNYRFVFAAGSCVSFWVSRSRDRSYTVVCGKRASSNNEKFVIDTIRLSYNDGNHAFSANASDAQVEAFLKPMAKAWALSPTPKDKSGWKAWILANCGPLISAAYALYQSLPPRNSGNTSGDLPALHFGAVDRSKVDTLLETYTWDCSHDWTSFQLSDHSREVISTYNDFSSNGLAYISDIKDIGSTIRTILGVASGSSKGMIRDAASVWLSSRFGDRLTIADTRELLAAIQGRLRDPKRSIPSRVRMTEDSTSLVYGFPIHSTRVSTVIFRPDSDSGLMTAVNNLMNWDIWPTLENMWDLVPFSFVVDWFLSVAKVLDHLDATVQAPYLRSRTQYASDLTEMSVVRTNASDGFRIDAKFSRYVRGRYNVVADIKPFEMLPPEPTFGVVNLVDAGALLVQLVG